MEELKSVLEMGSFVVAILTAMIAIKLKDSYRTIIKRTFFEALIIIGMIIFFEFYKNQEESIFDFKVFNNYCMLFLVIYLILICSDFILYQVDNYFKGSTLSRFIFVASLILLSFGIVLVVDNSDSNIKFLDDTPARFVDSDGKEFEIIIPKNTVIVWDKGSIINKEKEIKTPSETIVFHGEQNKIIFKESKELSLKANTIIYLNSSGNLNESDSGIEDNKYNLDFLNKDYKEVQFVLDTTFRLKKDENIILVQDTQVEIYKKLDKTFLISFLFLFGISLIFNFIFFHIVPKEIKDTNETNKSNTPENT